MKKRFFVLPAIGAILLISGTACSHTPEQNSDPLIGGWIASPQGKQVPENAGVFIGFWKNNTYTLKTRYGTREAQTEGIYTRTGENIYFDGKTRYRYRLNEASETLLLESADGTQTRYERVRMELLPAN